MQKKTFDKIQYSQQTKNRSDYLHLINSVCEISTTNNILNNKILRTSPL